jgi:hypothetical protein
MGIIMALTKDFRNTIFERAQKDLEFRRELLSNGINEL